MAQRSREGRIVEALNSLVGQLTPRYDGEHPDDFVERRADAYALATSILESQCAPAVVADLNHAGDLIKKNLIKNHPPEKALKFANLYSRLLTQPVLDQKWAILYLLHQLSDSADDHLSDSQPPRSQTSSASKMAQKQYSDMPPPSSSRNREDKVRDDAFAPRGLPDLSKAESNETRSYSRQSQEEPSRIRRMPAVNREDSNEGQDKHERRHKVQDEPVAAPSPPKRRAPSRPETPEVPEVPIAPLKKMKLADNHTETEPSEVALLRDLPFVFQGVSSTNMQFISSDTIRLPATLPPPLIGVLTTLSEPSLLYRQLNEFAETEEGGLIGQSFRAAIAEKLRSYLGLVAQIEGQTRRTLSSLDMTQPRAGLGVTGVTLRRCVVWTKEATLVLRLLSHMSESSVGSKGGQLISHIHHYSTSFGDPLIVTVAEQLLTSITRPFYDILRKWIYDGELSDPYHEFFVLEQDPNAPKPDDGRGRGAASSVWEDKYKIDEKMIPSIITEEFAQKVFLIGKSLNFIRHSCGDSLWVDDYSKGASKELRYGDTATLEAWIDEAYKTTMARLIHLMSHKFHLFEHLKALKDYLLLGQGDFIALLMESLAANLDRPAGVQYRHTLTAQLDHAIRGSNAQYDSEETRRRLDARMLHFSHGELGWDCFTLEYKIDAPIDVVVTEWGSKQYLKVFNFLWRIKRVEFMLTTTWRKCMTGARGVLQAQEPGVDEVWKSTRGVINEMIHFVGQLQYYILFEVIQSSWDELQSSIHKENCTLDDLIKAHTKYLMSITHKGLLGANKKGADGKEESMFMKQLNDLLHIMLSYRDAVDGLYSWSVAEFTRLQEASVRLETSHESDEDMMVPTPATTRRGPKHLGNDSFNSTPIPGAIPGLSGSGLNDDDVLATLNERLKAVGIQFKARLSVLLGDLAYQPDQDMRFLGVTMNFNDYYQARRRPSSRTAGGTAKKPAASATSAAQTAST